MTAGPVVVPFGMQQEGSPQLAKFRVPETILGSMRTIPSMSRRSVAALACLALSAPALAACGHSSTSADAAGTVKAVASTTQICDYITQLASGDASSELSFDRTGADGKTQHFGVDSAVDSTGFKGTMVVTSGVAGAADVDDLAAQKKKEEAKPYKVDRGSAKVEVAKWPFPPEEGESEPEFRFDPHVWTSPKNAIVQVTNIGAALEKAAPDQAGVFRSHVDAYVAKLKKLDEWAAGSLNSVPQDKRVLFTSHDAFGYFSKEFGVKFEGAALSDFNAQQDATADKIQQTADKVKASGAVAIFAENSNNPKSVQKVAEVAGVKAVIGDEALYGDSLGTPGSDGETYIGSILHNVSNLTKAWGGTVTEIPADLAQWTPKASDVK